VLGLVSGFNVTDSLIGYGGRINGFTVEMLSISQLKAQHKNTYKLINYGISGN